MRTKGFLVLAGALVVAPRVTTAQQRVVQVARAMGTRYIEPTCDLKAGHFLVSSAATYLKSGSEQGDPVKAEGLLENAVNTASKAITESDQAENGAAWYYMGRAYLRMGDIVGADTALTKASQFAPQCGEDIKAWRQRAWLPLVNPATKFSQEGNADSALAYFRMAATISRSMPQGFYNMGVLFANAGQVDSSIAYFKKAQEVAMADAKQFAKDRNSATFNLAAMYQRAGKHAEAVEELRKYVGWDPNDNDAKRALATSLRAIGKNDEASAIDKEVLAAAAESGTLTLQDRVAVAANLYNDALMRRTAADSMREIGDSVGAGRVREVANEYFQNAANAFRDVAAEAPGRVQYSYFVAEAYLALKQGDSLLKVSKQLVAREPLNEHNRRLLMEAFRFTGQQDSLLGTFLALQALPTLVTVDSFVPEGSEATIAGTAKGQEAKLDEATVPPRPVSISVEFLASDGSVVVAQTVDIPALEPGVQASWRARGSGSGIVSWRYKVK